jgi:endonuclease/exonuclease/phosphatase (EEP) superfamily protein YafD
MWDFPRLQIAALGAGMLGLMRAYGDRTATDRFLKAALGASVLYQIKKVIPYTPVYPKQMKAASGHRLDRRLRLLMINVYQFNDQFHRVRQAVEEADPDVICLVETDGRWERELRGLGERYPYSQRCPLANTYGMLLYSRLKLTSVETRFLVERDIPSMRAELHLRSGERVCLYCVHPRPPRPDSPSWGRDAELVLVGREVASDDQPALVMGDLNDVAWSYTTTLFQRISHMIDPRVGRGLYNSFHANHAWLRYPLDHVFLTRHFTLVELHRLPHVGSDHFPILAEVEYSPHDAPHNDVPVADQDDHEQAREMVRDAVDHSEELEGGLSPEFDGNPPDHV